MSNLKGADFGLLKFCLEHSGGSSLEEGKVPNRDPADYQWLKEALNNLESDADRMKKLMELLTKEDSSLEDKANYLEELQYLVEDIDNAKGKNRLSMLINLEFSTSQQAFNLT